MCVRVVRTAQCTRYLVILVVAVVVVLVPVMMMGSRCKRTRKTSLLARMKKVA